jgi:hypothetical protein
MGAGQNDGPKKSKRKEDHPVDIFLFMISFTMIFED